MALSRFQSADHEEESRAFADPQRLRCFVLPNCTFRYVMSHWQDTAYISMPQAEFLFEISAEIQVCLLRIAKKAVCHVCKDAQPSPVSDNRVAGKPLRLLERQKVVNKKPQLPAISAKCGQLPAMAAHGIE